VANVQRITPEVLDIHVPSPLRDLPIFLCWRLEPQYEGDPKPLKTPYYPNGGKRYGTQGSPEDRSKLTTYAVAKVQAAKRGMSGIGIALLEGNGIVAVDVDNCVHDGKVPAEILDAVGMTYAEYSPSGRGVRALLRGNVGNHKALTTLTDYGFEVFSTTGYVTLTGNMLDHVDLVGVEDTLARVSPKLVELCERRFGARKMEGGSQDAVLDFFGGTLPPMGLTVERMEELLGKLDPDMGREEWIRVGMALHHETQGDDTGFELWDEWSAGGSTYPSTEALRGQWDSFTRREGSGRAPVTMASVMKMANKPSTGDRPAEKINVEELSRVAAEATASTTPYDGRFPVISAGELARRKPVNWLIKGVLPQADLVVLFGASGSGKSFVGIDLMASIARGVAWRERRVKKARAIIIAAEGGGGMGKRIEAYCRHHNIDADDLDIGIITAPPDFMQSDDITDLVRAISASGGADVIMVDTFAQVTPGANENAGEDMGRALANARALSNATGAVVVLVHHAGKDTSKGSRGWSGIKAAADAEIEVIRHEDSPVREIRISKMKDGDDGLHWAFRLEVLDVGVDDDGDTITSCVAVEAEMPPAEIKSTNNRKYGRVESHIMEMIGEHVDPLASDADMEEVIRFCVDGMPKPEPGTRDVRKQHVQRALQSMCKGNDAPIAIEHGKVIFLSSN
jgi:hypothetical protein